METTPSEAEGTGWRSDWKSFGSPQFAAFGLLAVAVLILGFWFVSWSTQPTWSMVATGLSPSEASDARSELDGAGIENRLANGGSGIEVPSANSDEARVILGDSGVIDGSVEGYEILDRQGFTTSSFKQRIDFQRAVEGELTRTIRSMDAITDATVHLAIPEESVFTDNAALTRASVVVTGSPDQSTVAAIVNLVASAVPELDPSNVTVVDTTGRLLSSPDGTAMVSDQQFTMQQRFESQLEMDVQSMLAQTLGPTAAVVRVSAEMNFDESESETVTYTTDEQVALSQQVIDEAYTGDAGAPGGPLGVIDEFADAGQLVEGENGAYLRQEATTEFGVPSVRTVRREAPGRLERLSVAVLVDQNLEPLPDLAALQTLVAAAAGIEPARGDAIIVEAIAFDQTDAVDGEELAAPAAAGGSMIDTILGYLRTAVAIIGIVLALFFLRKGMMPLLGDRRENPALTAGSSGALGAGDDGAKANGAQRTDDGAGFDPETGSGATVDMFELIDQQPEEVADLLRVMIAEAK